jgi:hypothetical protein
MKKILSNAVLSVCLGTFAISCTNNPETTEIGKDSTNALTRSNLLQKEWDQYFTKTSVKMEIGLHQPVDQKIAENCIDSLEDLMRQHPDLKRIYHAYTESVWFGGQDLNKWFMDNHIFSYDSIAFRLGIYTQEAYLKYQNQGLTQEHIGRITVFIWPYKINPVTNQATTGTDPYNIGGIHP